MRVESKSSFSPIDIAISGIQGQGKRMKDISSNVASMSTTIGQAGLDPDAVGVKGGMTLDDLPAQMINLNTATRAYKANVAVLKRYEQMIETTLELLR